MALLEHHIPEYKLRTAVLVLPISVTIVNSSSGTEEEVYLKKCTRGLLTGDIVVNPGRMSKGKKSEQEVLVANAAVTFYDKNYKVHEVLVPFQFFTLE